MILLKAFADAHPDSFHFIRPEDFARRGGRSWCFFGSKRKPDGTKETVWLFHATSLPFHVYIKVRRDSNPNHPAWEMYFEEREDRHMARTLAERGTLLYLWRTQGGRCR